MTTQKTLLIRAALLVSLLVNLAVLSSRLQADTGSCGGQTITLPFTDVQSNYFFCSIAAAYFSGLTNGTTATTYSPANNVTRDQMAAFLSRTLDSALHRGSQRAATGKWWIARNLALSFHHYNANDNQPQLVYCDGNYLWVAWDGSGTVSRHGLNGDSNQITRWTGATGAFGILSNGHDALITGFTNPGRLYQATPGFQNVFLFLDNLPANPTGIACDGDNLWTANFGTGPNTGSISRINIVPRPIDVTTFSTGYNRPVGILFDGTNLWVTDGDGVNPSTLKRVNPATGQVTLTVTQDLGVGPAIPVFDGTNLWVPNYTSDTITVVRAVGGLAGTPLAVLTGNGLNGPVQGAFDGERILFTNEGASDTSLSLWKAADLTPIGNIVIPNNGNTARGACSDGINFYISTRGVGGHALLRP